MELSSFGLPFIDDESYQEMVSLIGRTSCVLLPVDVGEIFLWYGRAILRLKHPEMFTPDIKSSQKAKTEFEKMETFLGLSPTTDSPADLGDQIAKTSKEEVKKQKVGNS